MVLLLQSGSKRGGYFLAYVLFAARILRGLVYVALLIRVFIVYSSSIASKIEDTSLLRTRSPKKWYPVQCQHLV